MMYGFEELVGMVELAVMENEKGGKEVFSNEIIGACKVWIKEIWGIEKCIRDLRKERFNYENRGLIEDIKVVDEYIKNNEKLKEHFMESLGFMVDCNLI